MFSFLALLFYVSFGNATCTINHLLSCLATASRSRLQACISLSGSRSPAVHGPCYFSPLAVVCWARRFLSCWSCCGDICCGDCCFLIVMPCVVNAFCYLKECTHSVVNCLILIFTQTAFWLFNRMEWFGFVASGVQCLILCCCYECLCFNLGSIDFFHLSSICRRSLLMCFKVLPVCTVRVAACWHKYSQSHFATSFVIQYLVIALCFQAAYIRDLSPLFYCCTPVIVQSICFTEASAQPGWGNLPTPKFSKHRIAILAFAETFKE